MGKQVYEEWARQKLVELGDADQLALVPDEVGRAWNPRAKIDVLAVNWTPWSVLKISGFTGPLSACSSASRQKLPSRLFESRQVTT